MRQNLCQHQNILFVMRYSQKRDIQKRESTRVVIQCIVGGFFSLPCIWWLCASFCWPRTKRPRDTNKSLCTRLHLDTHFSPLGWESNPFTTFRLDGIHTFSLYTFFHECIDIYVYIYICAILWSYCHIHLLNLYIIRCAWCECLSEDMCWSYANCCRTIM